jgi:hypothetical protein
MMNDVPNTMTGDAFGKKPQMVGDATPQQAAITVGCMYPLVGVMALGGVAVAVELAPAALPVATSIALNPNTSQIAATAAELMNPNPGEMTMSTMVANALPGRAAVLNRLVEGGALRTTETVARQLAGSRSFIPTQAILETVASGQRVADPQGVKGLFMYSADVVYGAGRKTLDVLVNEETGVVAHALVKD